MDIPIKTEEVNATTFLRDNTEVLKGLNKTLARVREKRKKMAKEVKTLGQQRRDLVSKYVEKLVPNLEQETFDKLIRVHPLTDLSIETVFRQAGLIKIPLLVRITGGSSKYRANAMRRELDMLHVKLAAELDPDDLQVTRVTGASEINDKIVVTDLEIRKLADQEKSLSEQIGTLVEIERKLTRNRNTPVPSRITADVTSHADRLRRRRSDTVHNRDDDDDIDLLLLWALDTPTSLRTLFLSSMMDSHHETPAMGGGSLPVDNNDNGSSSPVENSGIEETPQTGATPGDEGGTDLVGDQGSFS